MEVTRNKNANHSFFPCGPVLPVFYGYFFSVRFICSDLLRAIIIELRTAGGKTRVADPDPGTFFGRIRSYQGGMVESVRIQVFWSGPYLQRDFFSSQISDPDPAKSIRIATLGEISDLDPLSDITGPGFGPKNMNSQGFVFDIYG